MRNSWDLGQILFVGIVFTAAFVGPLGKTPSLPWTRFSEASGSIVSARAFPCPGDLGRSLTGALLQSNGSLFSYFVSEDGRHWVLQRFGPTDHAIQTPDYVWFGSQEPSDDVMRVRWSMPHNQALAAFPGGLCAWFDEMRR